MCHAICGEYPSRNDHIFVASKAESWWNGVHKLFVGRFDRDEGPDLVPPTQERWSMHACLQWDSRKSLPRDSNKVIAMNLFVL